MGKGARVCSGRCADSGRLLCCPHFYMKGIANMGDVRLGFVGIVVEERGQAAQVNRILSQFGGMIRGRIGVPDTQTGLAVIGLIVEGTNDRLGAMTGKLGNLPGVTVKSAMTSRPDAKVPQTIDENGKER